MVNVFNPTGKEVFEHVDGHLIVVPAMGQAETTERKAETLLKLHPELSLGPVGQYAAPDIGAMLKLSLAELQDFCGLLMKGLKPPVPAGSRGATGTSPAAPGTDEKTSGLRRTIPPK